MSGIFEFTGIPTEGFAFLNELRENNDKEWFTDNKQRYIDFVQTPAVALVQELGQRLQAKFPNVHYDTRLNGSGSLMRIYRDTRFSKDKTPYKTNIAMLWWEGVGKKTANPAFGLQITPDSAGLMTGMHSFDKTWLTAYRDAVLDDKFGHELVEIVQTIDAAGDSYEVGWQHYKKTPRGYTDPADARSPLLLHNALYAHVTEIPQTDVMSAEFVDVCMTHFELMSPIQQWLVKIRA
ncbi:MAG: DUF2461 domain-containing protein [Anaerolineae bacterium]|nr:DUF2461 domain-containing protein [Anaerolineae bacterium]MDQ7034288.1 DUF2461 domain-containing protein [Anaerolineae bacterium]